MVSIPISFLFAFILAGLLLWVAVRYRDQISKLPKLTLSLIFIQSVLVGLRWTYGITDLLLVQATLATIIPPLVLMSMRRMVSTAAAEEPVERQVLYFLPAVLVMVSPALGLNLVDAVLLLVYVGFGGALVMLGLTSDLEWRDRVPFEGVVQTGVAYCIAGGGLLLSAAVDIAVALDMRNNGGSFAPQLIGITNTAILLFLAASVIFVNRPLDIHRPARSLQQGPRPQPLSSRPLAAAQSDEAPETAETALELLRKMDAAIAERKLYRDPELSLDKLSRKLVISSRHISSAVNSQRAMNVSQYINMFRVAEAAHLLLNDKATITEILYEVGFNTKSNFNREFQRIVGMSPSEFRKNGDSGENTPLQRFQAELARDLAFEPVGTWP